MSVGFIQALLNAKYGKRQSNPESNQHDAENSKGDSYYQVKSECLFHICSDFSSLRLVPRSSPDIS
jgi:hypothetical protein